MVHPQIDGFPTFPFMVADYLLPGMILQVGAKGSLLPPHGGHHRHRLPLFERHATLTVSESWVEVAEVTDKQGKHRREKWYIRGISPIMLIYRYELIYSSFLGYLNGESMVFPRVVVTCIIAIYGFRGVPRPDVKCAD